MRPAPPFGHRAAWAVRHFAAYGVGDRSATPAASRYSSPRLRRSSLLETGAAVIFVYERVLDRREDVFRRPALRALELRDRIGELGRADAAVEFVRYDTMPALTAIAPLAAERTVDVVVETPGRHVVAACRLVLSHGRPLSVRIS